MPLFYPVSVRVGSSSPGRQQIGTMSCCGGWECAAEKCIKGHRMSHDVRLPGAPHVFHDARFSGPSHALKGQRGWTAGYGRLPETSQ
eukprot:scaffold38155_cov17-Tisochrysis_lutea.AAC.1